MNDQKLKPFVVPLSVVTVLLAVVLFNSIERPKSDRRQADPVPVASANKQ
jgi:hypothetical protein